MLEMGATLLFRVTVVRIETKRIVSETESIFTFLVKPLDQKRVTCYDEKLWSKQ